MKVHRLVAVAALIGAAAFVGCPRENPEYVRVYDLVCDSVSDRLALLALLPENWPEIRNGCRRSAVTAADDEEFYRAVNCALFQLEVSHLGVVPSRDDWTRIEPAVFAPGAVGLEARKVGPDTVITAVAAGSPADLAGVRPGWILSDIGGTDVEQIEARLCCCSTRCLHRPWGIADEIASRLYGDVGSAVTIGVVDDRRVSHTVNLRRVSRGEPIAYVPDLPACYEEFSAQRLEGGVWAFRLNSFMPGNAERFEAALRAIDPGEGLVIDLRGNPGGHRLVSEKLASLLVSEPALLATIETSNGPRNVIVEPSAMPFPGPVVILVDGTSRSASEVFAAGLQAIGRARVVGERTPGAVGPAETIALPNGATLICPSGITKTPRGESIEGRGVIPDVTVTIDRRALLEGRDPVVEAAVGLIREKMVQHDSK